MHEFETIDRLLRPLATSPEALGLMDDAAALPSRPGFDLIVTTDTLVEGVHFLPDDPPDLIARKLLRVNLSDLAAKGAEPYGYFLNIAWSHGWDEPRRTAFARGLAHDQAAFGLKLFGGDTVSTPGPLTLSATATGWVRSGAMIRRSGARVGDVLLVSGVIGDGGLGLKAARCELDWLGPAKASALAARYRLPEPRLVLCCVLHRFAVAAADVSDGLLADAGHIAAASGCGVEIDLDRLPLSDAASHWLAAQFDEAEARSTLAASGDDYEIVCAVRPEHAAAIVDAAREAECALTAIGVFTASTGVAVRFAGRSITVSRTGWRHG
jgi:thiamine-monophosphate kinase